jgi:hypothetical protein
VDGFGPVVDLLAVDVFESVVYLFAVCVFESVVYFLAVDVFESVVDLFAVDFCESVVGYGEKADDKPGIGNDIVTTFRCIESGIDVCIGQSRLGYL